MTTTIIRTCEVCERKERGACTGWIWDPEHGGDFCPECAYSLASHRIQVLTEAARRVFDSADNPKSNEFADALVDLGLVIAGEEPNAR